MIYAIVGDVHDVADAIVPDDHAFANVMRQWLVTETTKENDEATDKSRGF